MNKIDELKFEIISEKKHIEKQKQTIENCKNYWGQGVRPSTASADIAMEEIILENAKDRLKEYEDQLRELENVKKDKSLLSVRNQIQVHDENLYSQKMKNKSIMKIKE